MAEEKDSGFVRDTLVVAGSVSLGAVIGGLFNAFGHYRHVYSSDPIKKEKELTRLVDENTSKMKTRLVVGGVIGALAGTAVGVFLASPGSGCCAQIEEE